MEKDQENNSFNTANHYAPTFDRFGFEITKKQDRERSGAILNENVKSLGRNDRRNMTFSHIKLQRK